jgi:hypothetical protein
VVSPHIENLFGSLLVADFPQAPAIVKFVLIDDSRLLPGEVLGLDVLTVGAQSSVLLLVFLEKRRGAAVGCLDIIRVVGIPAFARPQTIQESLETFRPGGCVGMEGRKRLCRRLRRRICLGGTAVGEAQQRASTEGGERRRADRFVVRSEAREDSSAGASPDAPS